MLGFAMHLVCLLHVETNYGCFVLFQKPSRVICDFLPQPGVCLSVCLFVHKITQKLLCRFLWNFACRLPTLQKLTCDSHKNFFWPLQNNFVTIYLQKKYLLLSQNNLVNIILLQSQNLFCKTDKAFWLYLTKNILCLTLTLTTKYG